MKLGVFTVMLPDLTPEEGVEELRAAGYEGVEWRVKETLPDRRQEAPSFWGNNACTLVPTTEDAERARELAASAGLEIPNLGTYIDVGDVAAVESAMQFAQVAGSPSVRVSPGGIGSSYRESFEAARAFLARVETLSERYQVRAMVEIHHRTICPSASLTHRLVSHFDPGAIGVIYDPGNMVHEGFEDYRMGLELLGPYLAHVHVKNAAFDRPDGGGVWRGRWAPLEDGVVDFQAFFVALQGIGYDHWMVVEDFSGVRASREALRHNIAFLQAALAQAGIQL